jgi:tetratricopeptide (TPR) repeat protein
VSAYKVARLQDIDEMTDGRCPWRPVRHHFGITSFGVNAWTGREAGDRIINEHDEDDEDEELYFVSQGRARFEIGGESADAPAGSFVYVDRGATRTAFAEEAGTTVIAVGARPGQAYVPLGWEVFAPVRPLYDAGRYAEAAALAREIAAESPLPLVLYNLACCEALAGHADQAIEDLRAAIERYPDHRRYARDDPDFESLRDRPEFRQLVGEGEGS